MKLAVFYRDQAWRTRKMARFIPALDVTESFEQLAREFDQIADDLEKRASQVEQVSSA